MSPIYILMKFETLCAFNIKDCNKEKLDTVIASESSLGKDCLLPEEDEAWQDL